MGTLAGAFAGLGLADGGSALAIVGAPGEVGVQQCDCHRAVSDSGGDTLDRPVVNIAGDEEPGLA
jgi:hypothetical protein